MSPLLGRLRSVIGAAAEPHSTELDTIFHQTTFNTQTTSSYLELNKTEGREKRVQLESSARIVVVAGGVVLVVVGVNKDVASSSPY